MENIKFDQLSTIDMETDFIDDDDFGGFGKNSTLTAPINKNIKSISVDLDNQGNIQYNKTYNQNVEVDYSNYNQIDMETTSFEDDDEDFLTTSNLSDDIELDKSDIDAAGFRRYGVSVDFSDDEDFIVKDGKIIKKESEFITDEVENIEDENNDFEVELISEDIINEKKKKSVVTQGQVEKDYLKKLQDKHKKSNTKGSYNGYFMFGNFDPEKNMNLFNHSMIKNTDFLSEINSDTVINDVVAGSNVSGVNTGEGCCEDYKKLYENLLIITGFKLHKNNDGTYTLTDSCDLVPEISCKDNNEITNALKPYIDDTITYPLQIQTGEKFTDPKDWCDWYTSEMEFKYPKCKEDIKYCDLLANHINDFTF